MSNAFNLSQLANNTNTSGQVSLTAGVTGTLPIANGGTNSTSTATAGGVGYGTGTAHAYSAAGTSGQALISAAANAPSFGTLGIAGGGTNSTATPTNGGVVYGDGSAHQVTAAGTSGYVLTSAGAAAPIWAAAGGGGVAGLGFQAFTSSGTFTIPTGCNFLKVILAAAGGSNSAWNGYYGAVGGSCIKYLTGLTPGNTLTVTVGTTAAPANNSSGNAPAGNASSVSSGTQTITTITATGGTGAINTGAGTGGTSASGTAPFNWTGVNTFLNSSGISCYGIGAFGAQYTQARVDDVTLNPINSWGQYAISYGGAGVGGIIMFEY